MQQPDRRNALERWSWRPSRPRFVDSFETFRGEPQRAAREWLDEYESLPSRGRRPLRGASWARATADMD